MPARRRDGGWRYGIRGGVFFAALATAPACVAVTWLPPGDLGLRSDVEILAARGLIDAQVGAWPLPVGILEPLREHPDRLASEPAYVQQAAAQVLAYVDDNAHAGVRPGGEMRVTNQPDVVRGFEERARDRLDTRAGVDVNTASLTAILRIGTIAHLGHGGPTSLTFDDTSLAGVIGNWCLYAGWVDEWQDGGWDSSLMLSTNARPFPKAGIMRSNPHAFATPWLRWLGPWQVHAYGGVLDGARIDHDTGFAGLRFSFTPARGLEISLARTSELCGEHHGCNPLRAAFHFSNDNRHPNSTNDEATIDVRYSGAIGALTVSPYLQLMNEDNGPFTHSDTSYLAGLSFAGAWGGDGAHWRLTAEGADSVASLNMFDLGKRGGPGEAYNNAGYPDGYRYRDRTLGFSLDSDSRLVSVLATLADAHARLWHLAVRHANISTSALAAVQATGSTVRNVVSARPLPVNQLDAGMAWTFHRLRADLSLRWQDREVTGASGGRVAGEMGLRYGL